MADVTRRLSLWLAGLAVACLPAGSLADKPRTTVADLRYGVVLYHYYQQDYLNALSELHIARERGGIQGHGDNPALMEAGISLSFGLQQQAENLYQHLLPGQPEPVREAAWFYLGKLHYLRGNWPQAEAYLARTGVGLEQPLAAERAALLTSLAIRRAELPESPGRRELRAWGDWAPYSLYNLGAAQARAGDFPQAIDFYQQLARLPAEDDTGRALRDRGLTGLGYAYVQQGDYPAALRAFARIPRDSPMARQALLGYGWAALQTGDTERALAPWLALRADSLMHPPVQESLLALPYAYEKLGAEAAALAAYEEGEQLLEQELQLLHALRTSLTPDTLLAALASPGGGATAQLQRVDSPESDNWLLLDRTSAIQSHSVYLTELFAENRFQAQAQALRDLLRLQQQLRQWLPRLDSHAQLLRDKQQLRSQRAQALQEDATLAQVELLRTQRDLLQARVQTIVAQRDVMALADAESRALYQRVERAQALIEQLAAAGRDTTRAQAELRLYRGILLWQAAQAYPDRLWRNQRLLIELDQELATLGQRSGQVQAILATDFDIEPPLEQLAAAGERVQRQLAQADQALLAGASQLRDDIETVLEEHQRRLHHYLAQTRLATARLYDSALRRQQP